jgi:hypothetical protein
MSAKSVADKLLIKPNTMVWSSDTSRTGLLQPLPEGVRLLDRPEGATTAVAFADDSAVLRRILERHKESLAGSAAFWVAYPKANRADVNRDSLWPILADYGFRPISQVAIDDVWSALRFRPLKTGEPRFTGGR